MSHFNTAEGWPQNRDEVDALSNDKLTEFMAKCHEEPADDRECLSCHAYLVLLDREEEEKMEPFENPEFDLIAFDEDEYNRTELRLYPDRYEMHHLRHKVGGGWYSRNVIACNWDPDE